MTRAKGKARGADGATLPSAPADAFVTNLSARLRDTLSKESGSFSKDAFTAALRGAVEGLANAHVKDAILSSFDAHAERAWEVIRPAAEEPAFQYNLRSSGGLRAALDAAAKEPPQRRRVLLRHLLHAFPRHAGSKEALAAALRPEHDDDSDVDADGDAHARLHGGLRARDVRALHAAATAVSAAGGAGSNPNALAEYADFFVEVVSPATDRLLAGGNTGSARSKALEAAQELLKAYRSFFETVCGMRARLGSGTAGGATLGDLVAAAASQYVDLALATSAGDGSVERNVGGVLRLVAGEDAACLFDALAQVSVAKSGRFALLPSDVEAVARIYAAALRTPPQPMDLRNYARYMAAVRVALATSARIVGSATPGKTALDGAIDSALSLEPPADAASTLAHIGVRHQGNTSLSFFLARRATDAQFDEFVREALEGSPADVAKETEGALFFVDTRGREAGAEDEAVSASRAVTQLTEQLQREEGAVLMDVDEAAVSEAPATPARQGRKRTRYHDEAAAAANEPAGDSAAAHNLSPASGSAVAAPAKKSRANGANGTPTHAKRARKESASQDAELLSSPAMSTRKRTRVAQEK